MIPRRNLMHAPLPGMREKALLGRGAVGRRGGRVAGQ
jgi:hypothetical protein